MIRRIVQYGHPALRQKGALVEGITPGIKMLVEDLLETMYAARGIGLAAQQIGEALQVTVVDVRALERPSSLELNGKPVVVDDFMPLVLINPEVNPIGDPVEGTEGCLSFPEVFAEIKRPETADVVALSLDGERIRFRCGGLLARAIQHELDHLNGILFIDRMDAQTKRELKSQLVELQARSKETLKKSSGISAG
jgi:peptide deformylase